MTEEFDGTIGRTYDDSTPWWPPLDRAPEGAPNVVDRAARRRRLRAVRVLRLRHRHADLRPARRRRAALRELPHDRAVLADPRLPADRSQPPLQRHGPRRRARRRASPATTRRSRRRTASSPRSSCATATPPTRSGSGTSRPATEMTMGSPRDKWPLGRGFERYYGFMGGETDQYHPDLVYDNHPVEPPRTPEEGYHLTEDLADQAILFLKDLRADRAGQAVLPLVHAGRVPRAAPGAGRVHRALPRPLRPGLGPVARGGVRAPGRVGPAAAADRAVGAARVGAGLGLAVGRRAAPLRPDDGGLRRLPDPHRRAGGPGARLHRRARRARQHDRHGDERQRRVGRGRAEGLVQRAVLLQLRAREPRGEPAPHRRPRHPARQQPLPLGLGVGREHAAQAVQARHPRGRRRRPADRALAGRHRDRRRDAAPVRARHRRHADAARPDRHRARPTSSPASSRPRSRG